MKYSLHPEAEDDLREAAEFYRERAGISLTQSLFAEFERSMDMLLQHPGLGALWRRGKRRYVMRHFPYALIYTVSFLAKRSKFSRLLIIAAVLDIGAIGSSATNHEPLL